MDVNLQFPELKEIRGEEDGNFQSNGSANLHIQVQDECEQTSNMLGK